MHSHLTLNEIKQKSRLDIIELCMNNNGFINFQQCVICNNNTCGNPNIVQIYINSFLI